MAESGLGVGDGHASTLLRVSSPPARPVNKHEPPDRHERVRERRANRRGELLTAAMEVIRRDGADATMEEMASAGGISKPILYRHFTDRDGLVAAITELALAELGPHPRARRSARRGWRGRATGSGPRSTPSSSTSSSDPELYRFVVDQDTRRSDSPTVAFTEGVAQHVAAAIREAMVAAGRDPSPADVWGRAIVGMVTLTVVVVARQRGAAPERRRRSPRRSRVVGHGPAAGGGAGQEALSGRGDRPAVRLRDPDAGPAAVAAARALRPRAPTGRACRERSSTPAGGGRSRRSPPARRRRPRRCPACWSTSTRPRSPRASR